MIHEHAKAEGGLRTGCVLVNMRRPARKLFQSFGLCKSPFHAGGVARRTMYLAHASQRRCLRHVLRDRPRPSSSVSLLDSSGRRCSVVFLHYDARLWPSRRHSKFDNNVPPDHQCTEYLGPFMQKPAYFCVTCFPRRPPTKGQRSKFCISPT